MNGTMRSMTFGVLLAAFAGCGPGGGSGSGNDGDGSSSKIPLRLAVTPGHSTIYLQEDQPLTATVTFNDGSESLAEATWTSLAPGVLNIPSGATPFGNGHAVGIGTATVRASYKGLDASAVVEVVNRDPADLAPMYACECLESVLVPEYCRVLAYGSDGGEPTIMHDLALPYTFSRGFTINRSNTMLYFIGRVPPADNKGTGIQATLFQCNPRTSEVAKLVDLDPMIGWFGLDCDSKGRVYSQGFKSTDDPIEGWVEITHIVRYDPADHGLIDLPVTEFLGEAVNPVCYGRMGDLAVGPDDCVYLSSYAVFGGATSSLIYKFDPATGKVTLWATARMAGDIIKGVGTSGMAMNSKGEAFMGGVISAGHIYRWVDLNHDGDALDMDVDGKAEVSIAADLPLFEEHGLQGYGDYILTGLAVGRAGEIYVNSQPAGNGHGAAGIFCFRDLDGNGYADAAAGEMTLFNPRPVIHGSDGGCIAVPR